MLLRMEVTAFHRNSIRSSLWPCSSPHGVRPLAGILLYGARTFLSRLRGSGCLTGFPACDYKGIAAPFVDTPTCHGPKLVKDPMPGPWLGIIFIDARINLSCSPREMNYISVISVITDTRF
jgi:hypothetical protein